MKTVVMLLAVLLAMFVALPTESQAQLQSTVVSKTDTVKAFFQNQLVAVKGEAVDLYLRCNTQDTTAYVLFAFNKDTAAANQIRIYGGINTPFTQLGPVNVDTLKISGSGTGVKFQVIAIKRYGG